MHLIFAVLVVGLAGVVPCCLADNTIDLAEPDQGTEASCPRTLAEEPLATEYGSAGIMKNLAETDDSIKAVAHRLLEQALTVESRKPAAGCSADCPDHGVAEVIYRVAPQSFLARAEQDELCLRLEEETASEPMRFTPAAFAGFEPVNAWIADLSQGRGEDGKALYDRCASNCSPRYTFFIAAEGTGYKVRADVLCGLARDKSNDQYLISTALKRSCATP